MPPHDIVPTLEVGADVLAIFRDLGKALNYAGPGGRHLTADELRQLEADAVKFAEAVVKFAAHLHPSA